MRLSLKHFKIFVAVAETGQISKAAKMLFASQPVVTEAIKSLETELGLRLFKRHAKGVSLTPEGQVFWRHAREVLDAATEAMQAPHRVTNEMEGEVKLACTQTVAGYFLPPVLNRFKRQYPGIRVNLLEMSNSAVAQQIREGAVELAMCLTSPMENLEDINIEVLVRSKRRLWLPGKHPLTDRKIVSLKDIVDEPYIMLKIDDSDVTTQRYWHRAGLKPKIAYRTSSMEAMRNMVAIGLGVTILSDMIYRPWTLDNIRLEARPISDNIPSMDIGLAWSRHSDLSLHAQVFADVCRGANVLLQDKHSLDFV